MKNKESFLYKTKDYIAFKFVEFLFFISKYVPISITNTVCGVLAVLFCPLVPATRTAFNNIKMIMSELKSGEIINLIFKIWYNLGLFGGEFSYVYSIENEKFDKLVFCSEESQKLLKQVEKSGKGAIFFSAHFSNWEIGLRYLARFNFKLNVVFRKSNNEKIENIYINGLREKFGINMIAKGDNAGIKILRALKNKEVVIILADQRDDRGELLDFMGQKAYTNISVGAIGLKSCSDIYGIRVVRKNNKAKFEIICDKYIDIEQYKDNNLDFKQNSVNIMQEVNDTIGSWVKENPEQWFWVHNRWKKR